jgi:hypothetical protein
MWPAFAGEIESFSPIPRFAAIAKNAEHGLPDSSDWLEHDPEKWKPVLRKDHAQTKSMIRRSGRPVLRKDHAQTKTWDHDPISSDRIMN